jgi:acyl carrier protein
MQKDPMTSLRDRCPQQPASGELEWRVIQVVCKNLGIHPGQVRPDDPFLDVVGHDSLDIIELVMELEEEFQVSLPQPWWDEIFPRNPAPSFRQLAAAIALRASTTPPPATRLVPLRIPVAEQAPFLQLGGRVSEWQWLNGPLYDRWGTNSSGMMEFRRRTDGMRCVQLPAAKVTASSSDSGRPIRAEVAPFLIDAEPISNLAYSRFLSSIRSVPPAILQEWCGTTGEDHRGAHFGLEKVTWWLFGPLGWWAPRANTHRQPMILVSWYGAAAYSLWANRLDWRYYRGDGTVPDELRSVRVKAPPPRAGELALPSELEWEYAARGTEPQRYPWGDAEPTPDLLRVAQHHQGQHYTADSLPAADVCDRLGMSPFGLHHMAGNVWQWCRDWYRPGSTPLAATEPTGIRSERGGSWVGPARLAECGYRRGRPPLARGRCLGFRCVGALER